MARHGNFRFDLVCEHTQTTVHESLRCIHKSKVNCLKEDLAPNYITTLEAYTPIFIRHEALWRCALMAYHDLTRAHISVYHEIQSAQH